jgi:hypothetical protein
MTDMNTVNDRLDWFVHEMRRKLAEPKNIAKGDWREMGDASLFQRVEDEFRELKVELFDVARPVPEKIIKECADVANFCFMLADFVRSNPHHYEG